MVIGPPAPTTNGGAETVRARCRSAKLLGAAATGLRRAALLDAIVVAAAERAAVVRQKRHRVRRQQPADAAADARGIVAAARLAVHRFGAAVRAPRRDVTRRAKPARCEARAVARRQ